MEQKVLGARAGRVLFSGPGLLVLAAAVLLLAIPAVRHLREEPPPPAPAIRVAFAPPPGADLGTGDEALDATISPDERQVVFVATTDGIPRLWRRALDSDRAEPLPGTEGAHLPAWKHTGTVVSFFAAGRLKQFSLTDSVVHDLAEAASPAGAAWLPDGSLVFAPTQSGALKRLHEGRITDATVLGESERAHTFPAATGSPGGFVYTVTRGNNRRAVRLVDGTAVHDLTTTSGHGQLVGDTLLHVRDEVLIAQRVDPSTRTLSGQTVALANGVGVAASGRSQFVASPRLLLSAGSAPRARELAWFDYSGQPASSAGDPGDYWQVRLSPDDRSAAVTIVDPLLRTLDIVVMPTAAQGGIERLSRAIAADSDPVWSPEGTHVLYRSLVDGQANLFTRRAHDSEAAIEPLLRSDLDETPTDWRASSVLFHAPGTTMDIWMVDTRTRARDKVVDTGFNETDARRSPDGRRIAYVSDESGRPDIYVTQPHDNARVRVSFAGGTRPRWGRDGRSLFFLRGSAVMRAHESSPGGSELRFATAQPVFEAPGVRDFDVAHRTDRVVALIPAKAAEPGPVAATIDWQSMLASP